LPAPRIFPRMGANSGGHAGKGGPLMHPRSSWKLALALTLGWFATSAHAQPPPGQVQQSPAQRGRGYMPRVTVQRQFPASSPSNAGNNAAQGNPDLLKPYASRSSGRAVQRPYERVQPPAPVAPPQTRVLARNYYPTLRAGQYANRNTAPSRVCVPARRSAMGMGGMGMGGMGTGPMMGAQGGPG
jgi:hypothetical protein